MIETEKATDRLDLPHAYERAGLVNGDCKCGRMADDQLHSTRAREVASTGATLEREKGS